MWIAAIALKEINLNVVHISQDSYDDLVDRLNDVMADLVMEGRVLSSDFTDDLMLRSALLLDDRKVRINKFHLPWRNQPFLTANCVPLTSVDIPASNGVIHVVEKVLPSAVNSIAALVSSHPSLTIFNSLFRQTLLDTVNGSYTIFAPSDDAFARLHPSLLQRLQNGDIECAARLLRQHVLPRVVCASALKSTASNLRFNLVNVDRRHIHINIVNSGNATSKNITLFAGGVKVVEEDLMATNGVLHVTDGILFNESVVGVLEVAKLPSMNTNLFAELIDSSGLRRRIESMNTSFTVFLPTNDAIQEMANETANMSASELQQFLAYHLVPQALTASNLQDDRTLTTMDNNSKLLIKEYHSFPFSHRSRKTVQCAAVVRPDINANSICSGGIGHVISTVLRRPATSILEILSNDSKFSRLIALYQFAGLSYLLTYQGSPVTLIAPTNAAFDALPAATLNRLTTDVNTAQRVLRSHIIQDVMCCTGVFQRQFLQLPVSELNLEGWLMQVDRQRQTVTIEQVPIKRCDQMAANGIVHVVERFASSAIGRYIRTSGRSRTSDSLLQTVQDFLGLS